MSPSSLFKTRSILSSHLPTLSAMHPAHIQPPPSSPPLTPTHNAIQLISGHSWPHRPRCKVKHLPPCQAGSPDASELRRGSAQRCRRVHERVQGSGAGFRGGQVNRAGLSERESREAASRDPSSPETPCPFPFSAAFHAALENEKAAHAPAPRLFLGTPAWEEAGLPRFFACAHPETAACCSAPPGDTHQHSSRAWECCRGSERGHGFIVDVSKGSRERGGKQERTRKSWVGAGTSGGRRKHTPPFPASLPHHTCTMLPYLLPSGLRSVRQTHGSHGGDPVGAQRASPLPLRHGIRARLAPLETVKPGVRRGRVHCLVRPPGRLEAVLGAEDALGLGQAQLDALGAL
jgi:hypothetical protein